MNTAHRFPAWILGLCALALLAGCATGPRITTEADPRADFSQYRSFGFYSPLAIEDKGYATQAGDAARAAVRRQMEARGYVYDPENPDLWVNINAYLERRTDVSTIPTIDYGYYYSYRSRAYFAVPYWGERTHVYRYTEGTMNIDLVDVRENRLVWEGVAVGRVSNLKPEQRAERVDAAVAEIFARYPHRAGIAATQ